MLLLIDTSSVDSIVCLGNEQGEIIDIRKNITKLKLSQTLLSGINLLLRRNRASFEYLKGIVVVQGPGSFTGLRVGTSVANSLGYGLKIPVAGVRKLKVQSSKLKVKNAKFEVEAKRLKIYYRNIFKRGLKKLKYTKIGRIARPFYGGAPYVTVPKEA